MRYIVSIGSNLLPSRHVPDVMVKMCQSFQHVVVSRFVRTKAYAMSSRHVFWNGAVSIDTHLARQELKLKLNRWEAESGRDRNHPHCSVRDRTLDLDILWSAEWGWLDDVHTLKTLPYVWQPVASLLRMRCAALEQQKTVRFNMQGVLVGGRRRVLK